MNKKIGSILIIYGGVTAASGLAKLIDDYNKTVAEHGLDVLTGKKHATIKALSKAALRGVHSGIIIGTGLLVTIAGVATSSIESVDIESDNITISNV